MLKLKEIARERGVTLSAIARHFKMHRSNMSAIAAGERGVSLRFLRRLCAYLSCGMDELVGDAQEMTVFKETAAEAALRAREAGNFDGMDKTWVNQLMLGQRVHYGRAKKQ